MKSQHVALLATVIDAITNLAAAGNGINVTVNSVTVTFPDGRATIFTQDASTGEIDWVVIST